LSFKKYKAGQSEVQGQQQESENNYATMAENQIYYYHPNHLGTATYLTDINGKTYEIEDSSNTFENKN
jgi:hypothetical protein